MVLCEGNEEIVNYIVDNTNPPNPPYQGAFGDLVNGNPCFGNVHLLL